MAISTLPKPLIAISVRKLDWHPFPFMPRAKQAFFVGKSSVREYCFEYESGAIVVETAEKVSMLQQHGFTVVEYFDEDYRFQNNRELWLVTLIERAVDRVAAIYKNEGNASMSNSDTEFRLAVLQAVQDVSPERISMIQLKNKLTPEPSNKVLLHALMDLKIDEYIEGDIRQGMSELQVFQYVQITAKGRQHLRGETPTVSSTIYNNYAITGAMGTNAHGVVNVNDRWAGIERDIDLDILAGQLEQVRVAYRKTATTRDDDTQIALIASAAEAAEKKDGKGMAGILSCVGKGALKVAKEAGTDLLAKVIVEMTKPG